MINIKDKKIKYFFGTAKSFVCFCDFRSTCVTCKKCFDYDDALVTQWD